MTTTLNRLRIEMTGVFTLPVVVAALGYFVDIYDLVLFGIVRVPSLLEIGVPEADLFPVGAALLNWQMGGMLLGGLIWGILGDKLGRLNVLFGSILMYSLANIANAFVTDVTTYATLRFIAGIGLAGELGAAVTLVSEIMSKEKRGYATAIIASVGVCGAIAAAMVSKYVSWQAAYVIGGLMGLALLVLRLKVFESGMFEATKKKANVVRGSLAMLLTRRRLLGKYIACILIGVPIWYVVAVLAMFAPELGSALQATAPLEAGTAVMLLYIGLIFGDMLSGFASQILRSRRWVVFSFITLTILLTATYLLNPGMSPAFYYTLCLLLGVSVGYWAVFVTIGAEQFGTNLRATVATSVPNFVRGAVVPVTWAYLHLKESMALPQAAWTVGLVCFVLALLALWRLPETYGKDLDYNER